MCSFFAIHRQKYARNLGTKVDDPLKSVDNKKSRWYSCNKLWFRKNTFSGRYLNFLSNHSFKQKIAITKNLVDTAILLSHEKFHEENLEIIKNLLVLNNESNLFNKHINIRIFQIKNKNTILEFIPNNKQTEIDYKRVVSTPYFGNLSYKIKRLLNDYNLTTVFRNTSKLDKYIKLGKDPLEKLENTNVIYKIPYLNCSKTYVGQTGRMLFVRCEEHKKNINLNENFDRELSKISQTIFLHAN